VGAVPRVDPALVVLIVLAVLALVLVLAVVFTIINFVAKTALIAGVNRIEEGEEFTWRLGFRLGWSKRALHLFLIELLFGLVKAAIFIPAFLLALSPLLLLMIDNAAVRVMAIIFAVSLFLLVSLLAFAVQVVTSPWMELIRRHCVLEEAGVLGSIKEGFYILRDNLKDTAIMWLVMTGVSFGWGLFMIPVLIVALIIALIVGGIPAAMLYVLARTWVWPLLVGLPLGLVTLLIPLLFLSGLYLTYQSTVWTLAYREMKRRS